METLQKKSLFWDVRDVDPHIYEHFVMERILRFGDTDDVAWAMRFYGREKMKDTVRTSRELDRKSLSFWCQFFNIDKATCRMVESMEQPSAWSQRLGQLSE